VITQAFTQAARIRAEVLGLPEHPVVVVAHPLASKSREETQHLAPHSVEAVVRGLVAPREERDHG
jgi:predicted dienelactone hydrolase